MNPARPDRSICSHDLEPLEESRMDAQNIAARPFDLSGRNVVVWSVRTKAPSAVAEQFELLLGPDEKDRAARFRFDNLRHSFVIARGALRILLGHYLNVSPISIQFKYASRGKPSLTAPSCIDFNVSHSGDLAVFAFATGCELGVDVEQIRALPEVRSIADRFFCSEETAELMSLNPKLREHAFYLCWTRKEAYIKAIGEGLSAPLDRFRVTLQPGQPARFIHIAGDTGAARAWTLHDLQLSLNYAAALAYRDSERPAAVLPVMDPGGLLSIPTRSLD
jgi:4'-phosphopantetheinyl transferase